MKNLKQIIGTGIVGIGGIAGLCGLGGCDESLMQGLVITGAQQAVVSEVRNGIEGPRSPTIIVNNESANTNTGSTVYDTTPYMALYVCNKWVDINHDGRIDFSNELFGVGKSTFNLDREDINCIVIKKFGGPVTLESWTSDGRKIGENTYNIIHPHGWILGYTGPGLDCPNQGEFIDNIKGAGAGNYRITARDEKTILSVNIRVDRDK